MPDDAPSQQPLFHWECDGNKKAEDRSAFLMNTHKEY
jgi:hypothetical protein